MKTLNLKTSKRLKEYLKDKEVEAVYKKLPNGETELISTIKYEAIKNVFIPSLKAIKTLTLEEAIEFLPEEVILKGENYDLLPFDDPKFLNKKETNFNIVYTKHGGFYLYRLEKLFDTYQNEGATKVFGKDVFGIHTIHKVFKDKKHIEALEKLINYLLDNKLI